VAVRERHLYEPRMGYRRGNRTEPRAVTTFDRMHRAMLFKLAALTNSLPTMVQAKQDRDPDFLRVPNALFGRLIRREPRKSACSMPAFLR
jgi:hypothetical protein